MTNANCYYYKIVHRPTNSITLVNFGWASSFAALAKRHGGAKFACIEITKEEFQKLREQGK